METIGRTWREIQVLEFVCSLCGHTRRFRRGGQMTIELLESISHATCSECGGCKSVIGFKSYAANRRDDIEKLPTQLH